MIKYGNNLGYELNRKQRFFENNYHSKLYNNDLLKINVLTISHDFCRKITFRI